MIERVLESIEPVYCSGLTILGGEPLDPNNLEGVNHLIDRFRERFGKSAEKTLWLYTGYKFDSLTQEQPNVAIKCDTVVDGPFELEKADINLAFRGSSNQKIINVNEL